MTLFLVAKWLSGHVPDLLESVPALTVAQVDTWTLTSEEQGLLAQVCFEKSLFRAVLCGAFLNIEMMLDSVRASRIPLPLPQFSRL